MAPGRSAKTLIETLVVIEGGTVEIPDQVCGTVTSVAMGVEFIRGDCNNDGFVDLSDVCFLLEFLFEGGIAPACEAACDANGDFIIDLADAIFIVNYCFLGGAAPPFPFPECGVDPMDRLTCEGPTTCEGEILFDPDFVLDVGDGVTVGLAPTTVDVSLTNPVDVHGFVLAVCVDPEHAAVTDVSIDGTITQMSKPEFVASQIFANGFTLAVLLDLTPPFGQTPIPPGVGEAIAFFEVTPVVAPVAPVLSDLTLCDGTLGMPIKDNLVVVDCVSIHPELLNGLLTCLPEDDDCVPVDPDVRTQGFWKRVCSGPHPSGENENLPGYVDFVNGFETFADVADVTGLCDRMNPDPQNDMCEKAEAQFMALLLNLASGRVAECNCVEDDELGSTTVGEVAEFIDSLLSNPDRDFFDCVTAKSQADAINNGGNLVPCP